MRWSTKTEIWTVRLIFDLYTIGSALQEVRDSMGNTILIFTYTRISSFLGLFL